MPPAKGNQPTQKRTQAERREATQALLLAAAREQFGAKGYAHTNLEDIAAACAVTIRPIYHYYKNKLGLFTAVIEQIEAEMVSKIEGRIEAEAKDVWSGFMANCEDPHFRQIILIDGPALLGRRRMTEGVIPKAARERTAKLFGRKSDGLSMNMLMGALSSAALYIAENGANHDDYEVIRRLIDFHSRPESR